MIKEKNGALLVADVNSWRRYCTQGGHRVLRCEGKRVTKEKLMLWSIELKVRKNSKI